MAFLEGDNLVVFYFLRAPEICPNKQGALSGGGKQLQYFTICVHLTFALVRGVASIEGDSLLLLYFALSLHQEFGWIIKRVWCLVGEA